MGMKVLQSRGLELGNSNQNNEENFKPDSCYGARHTQIILLFILITLGYIMRVVLSVGIVAMTDPNASPNPNVPTYDWDDQSVILSSFFFGYIVPQIAAGQLAKYYGPKYFLLGAMTVTSLFSILIPVMAQFGSWGVIVCRVFQGLSQGFMYPSCHHLLSRWAPLSERSRSSAFIYSGGPFGTVIGLPLTGWICGSWLGWPFAYYIYGALGLVWVVMWFFLGKNSPSEHTNMDPIERKYIESSLNVAHDEKPIPTPWKSIFTSLPFWAILIAQTGQNWGFSTLLTNIPRYMAKVLHFDIESNGVLSAGPYLLYSVLSIIFSGITDWVVTRKTTSLSNTRKIANTIGSVGPAVALIILGIIGSNSKDITIEAVALLYIAVGINSATACGYQVNHMDIGPVHAGTLMGITNGLSNISSIIGPLIIQYIVTEESNPYQWATIFYISAVVFFSGNLFFVIFGSGIVQAWNYSGKQSSPISSEITTKNNNNEERNKY
ncbi:hypothetical protein FQR65_LT06423 [Abscondita terminalis]|nr:hypothetical protein FQR65_LT06423 [Abscondita terminalis]